MREGNDHGHDGKWPVIRYVGFDGMLVSFSRGFEDRANRAAIAFRVAVDRNSPKGVVETSVSLVSTYVQFDPLALPHEELKHFLLDLLDGCDWYSAPLPEGRKQWSIPVAFDASVAPDLPAAARAAGLSLEDAVKSLSDATVRVQTIGFKPGQPYLGRLPGQWDIPRRAELRPNVPVGALVVAIRQFVLFAVDSPTGWWHVGQTAFRPFLPDDPQPFRLSVGDEVRFRNVSVEELKELDQAGGEGGAYWEPVA